MLASVHQIKLFVFGRRVENRERVTNETKPTTRTHTHTNRVRDDEYNWHADVFRAFVVVPGSCTTRSLFPIVRSAPMEKM